jgi:SET domain-containing protein
LFATRPFHRGDRVLEFTGEELTLAEVRAKGPHAADGLQIGVGRYLDLVEPGRLANHSCRPNAGVFGDRTLRALRDIAADEEVVFDYSTTIADGWTMPCGCGVAECRGTVRAYVTLPRPVQERYRILGCVSAFLVRDVGA